MRRAEVRACNEGWLLAKRSHRERRNMDSKGWLGKNRISHSVCAEFDISATIQPIISNGQPKTSAPYPYSLSSAVSDSVFADCLASMGSIFGSKISESLEDVTRVTVFGIIVMTREKAIQKTIQRKGCVKAFKPNNRSSRTSNRPSDMRSFIDKIWEAIYEIFLHRESGPDGIAEV